MSAVNEFDELLLGMLRAGGTISCAAAAAGLVLAIIEPWQGSPARRITAGVLILMGNLAAYAWRKRLYALQVGNGAIAVAISLAAGGLLVLADTADTPYFEALLVGVGLAAITGQVGWSLLAALALAGSYEANLALHGDPLFTRFAFGNVVGTFMLAGALGSLQWWFARFVNDAPMGDHEPAPLADARWITMHEEQRLLPAGPRRRSLRSLMPGRPDEGVCTLSARERVERLSELQLAIFRLQAAGLRKAHIAKRLHISASTLYRERRQALAAAHARTDEQLAGMVVYCDPQAIEDEDVATSVG